MQIGVSSIMRKNNARKAGTMGGGVTSHVTSPVASARGVPGSGGERRNSDRRAVRSERHGGGSVSCRSMSIPEIAKLALKKKNLGSSSTLLRKRQSSTRSSQFGGESEQDDLEANASKYTFDPNSTFRKLQPRQAGKYREWWPGW